MKVKILAPFQTDCGYYRDNEAINWTYEPDALITPFNKFHYFKFLEVDTTWTFEDGVRYIFPLLWDSARKHIHEIIEFINANHQYFACKKLIPVFMDPLEGDWDIATVLDYVSQMVHVDVYFVSADYKLKERKNLFKFLYVNQWLHHVPASDSSIIFNPERDYINLNRVGRLHRCMLMQNIIDKGILTQGYNTWAHANWSSNADFFEKYVEMNPGTTIKQQTYDVLDIPDIEKTNPTFQIPREFCEKSFMYVVTETHYTNKNLFLSEKVYKPISIGMPFMVLGNPGTLTLLREQGYLTFSDWIDESYDNDYPIEKRIDILVRNLCNFVGWKTIRKQKIRYEMAKICNHNLELYKLLQRKNSLLEALTVIKNGAV